MVRAVERIEQEIAALDQTVTAIAQAFHDSYHQYLNILGRATRQQLIVAGYHICTHGYPEQFLALPLSKRQDLQQSLQRLAKQGQTDLLACLRPLTPLEVRSLEREQKSIRKQELTKAIQNAVKEADQSFSEEPQQEDVEFHQSALELEEFTSDLEPDLELDEEPVIEHSLTVSMPLELVQSSIEFNPAEIQIPPPDVTATPQEEELPAPIESNDRPLTPRDIAYWQAHLEEHINQVLQNLSRRANQLLQQSDVLPNRLPEPVLEVAAKVDLSSETVSPPNLLNLLIEAEEEEGKPSMTQIIAIRLRLSEIEFGDPATAAQRSKLRQLLPQLTKLGRDYQRKQKEYAIAQAEAVWRSSWFETEE